MRSAMFAFSFVIKILYVRSKVQINNFEKQKLVKRNSLLGVSPRNLNLFFKYIVKLLLSLETKKLNYCLSASLIFRHNHVSIKDTQEIIFCFL